MPSLSYPWLGAALEFSAEFVAFDLETTGLDPSKEAIAEVGAVRFGFRPARPGQLELFQEPGHAVAPGELLELYEAGSFGSFVDPGKPMPADAGKINGITDAMLAGAPSPPQVLARFAEFASGAVLVAHNAPFDISFIIPAMERHDIPRDKFRVVDTRLLAKDAWPSRRSYRLQDLLADLGIPPGRAHRALDDARACMELFRKCLRALQLG